MLKIVQYLIKSRPNSLSLGKSWKVALASLVPQGFKTPLQSKDTALFQRDWDNFCSTIPQPFRRKTLPCSKGIETSKINQVVKHARVERHCPVPKGLRHPNWHVIHFFYLSKDTALFQRDWDDPTPYPVNVSLVSKDTALFQRDWDGQSDYPYLYPCRKTLPCSKGIETSNRFKFPARLYVERHCPVPKGLRHVKVFSGNSRSLCRKTLPCSKGIETAHTLPLAIHVVRRKTLPCSKGIETIEDGTVQSGTSVERHCPVPKGLRHIGCGRDE